MQGGLSLSAHTMTDPSNADPVSPVQPASTALPVHMVSHEVPVSAALSHLPELRNAVQVCEWMVEPVQGSTSRSLTLVLSENVSLCFLLSEEDAQDLGFALRRGQPDAAA